MNLIYTKSLPPKGYIAITLFGVVLVKRKLTGEERTMKPYTFGKAMKCLGYSSISGIS